MSALCQERTSATEAHYDRFHLKAVKKSQAILVEQATIYFQ
tara:strand:- start:1055 stop:1177 length:123 start_codon:yes stop_codon:yes gene_type:complete